MNDEPGYDPAQGEPNKPTASSTHTRNNTKAMIAMIIRLRQPSFLIVQLYSPLATCERRKGDRQRQKDIFRSPQGNQGKAPQAMRQPGHVRLDMLLGRRP